VWGGFRAIAPQTKFSSSQTKLAKPPSPTNRDKELAKFEAFLNKEQCQHINALVRNRSRLAYPMKGNQWEGIYVLYTYAAKRSTARAVQQLLSNPEAGSEDILLRFCTFCKF